VKLRNAPLIDRRTQHHPLSAAINQRRSPDRLCGTGSMLLPCAAVCKQDSAADGWQLVLHSAPRSLLCAEAFMAIEADIRPSVLAGWRLSACVAG